MSVKMTRALKRKLNTYIKFLIVRHPYQRLLSAYRDKLEGTGEEFYIKNYAYDIAKTYRQDGGDTNISKPGNGLTFSEFVSYVSDRPKDGFDEHWRPYTQLCFPCDIHYDVIGKYETLVKDSEYFLRLIGAPEDLHFPTFVPSNTSALLEAYMASLSQKQRESLRTIYRKDFQMFNYEEEI
ncbi:carbohydrate sulfotransferase 11-like [Cherax quadricarinatus]